MPDNHVLGIADERGDTANVGAGRERDQIGQQRKSASPDHRYDERRQHQTNRIVHEQRRENARRKREIE
jgi:hypothetical protein